MVNSNGSTPAISTILYNNATHTFETDNSINGSYIVSPQLSFPSLQLDSIAPSYVNFEMLGGPTLAFLSYNNTALLLKTVNINYIQQLVATESLWLG